MDPERPIVARSAPRMQQNDSRVAPIGSFRDNQVYRLRFAGPVAGQIVRSFPVCGGWGPLCASDYHACAFGSFQAISDAEVGSPQPVADYEI